MSVLDIFLDANCPNLPMIVLLLVNFKDVVYSKDAFYSNSNFVSDLLDWRTYRIIIYCSPCQIHIRAIFIKLKRKLLAWSKLLNGGT